MKAKQLTIKRIITNITGDETTMNRIPVLNQVIAVYLSVCMVTFVLFLIAPAVTLLSRTPLYSAQSYLGILGAFLLLIDLFTNRGLWHGPYCWLLYGLCLAACVSSLLTASYGITDNLFLICWTAIQFSLFYSLGSRIEGEKLQKYLGITFFAILAIWLVACLISLVQYVYQIGYHYVVDPFSDDQSPARQGFLDNRLFGIFNPLNHAAHVSVALVISTVYYFKKIRNTPMRVLLCFSGTVFFLHVLLSGSRSGMLALLLSVLVFAWFAIRNHFLAHTVRMFFVETVLAICVMLAFIPCIMGVRALAGAVPELMYQLGGEEYEDIHNSHSDSGLTEKPFDDILDREGLEEDSSNGRISIWKDYLSLYKEVGLFGMSPGNYMPLIKDNYPDLYIVKYIRENFPGKYENGTIYHVHSGYMMVYVSTGFVGVGLALAFIILCVKRIIQYLMCSGRIPIDFVVPLSLASAGALAAFFDKGIFFMDNPQTFVFWIAMGIVMNRTRAIAGRSNCIMADEGGSLNEH